MPLQQLQVSSDLVDLALGGGADGQHRLRASGDLRAARVVHQVAGQPRLQRLRL